MTNSERLKRFLLCGVVAASVAAIGGLVYISAEESRNLEIAVDGSKPLDNLGEIAEEQTKTSEKELISLYSKDEKVGEIVKLEGLNRVDTLGNSNKEFETFEDAQSWAETKLKEEKILTYSIFPIRWSDNQVHSYTVDVVESDNVKLDK